MSGWAAPYQLLKEEFKQRRDEGCAIPQSLVQQFAELDATADAWNLERIDRLYDALMALECDRDLEGREPNDLAAIRAQRPPGPRDLHYAPTDGELLDRLHGAWTGRCTGCALGKPVEMRSRGEIKKYLQNRGDWPMKDFVSGRDVGDGVKLWCPQSQRENIAFMEPDDDIHYTLIALSVLEDVGPAFAWPDVYFRWRDHIPMGCICTAERQAILNAMNRSDAWHKPAATEAFTRRYRNPYREWIGAQIRSDGWAWGCAGKPELAAELAYRDACWTHERNGIYGEMFMAAIQAAAFVVHDVDELIGIGMSEIPINCRLSQAVLACQVFVRECRDWESCMARIEEYCGDMSPVHTINNALVCVMSLYYGKMDTMQTPLISVMAGMDTDCNGATVGSIVGAAAGQQRFDKTLSARLNDRVVPSVIGFADTTMTDLARRTLKVWHKVDEYRRP